MHSCVRIRGVTTKDQQLQGGAMDSGSLEICSKILPPPLARQLVGGKFQKHLGPSYPGYPGNLNGA